MGEDGGNLSDDFHGIATGKWARCKIVWQFHLTTGDRGAGSRYCTVLKNPVNGQLLMAEACSSYCQCDLRSQH